MDSALYFIAKVTNEELKICWIGKVRFYSLKISIFFFFSIIKIFLWIIVNLQLQQVYQQLKYYKYFWNFECQVFDTICELGLYSNVSSSCKPIRVSLHHQILPLQFITAVYLRPQLLMDSHKQEVFSTFIRITEAALLAVNGLPQAALNSHKKRRNI